MYKNSDDHYVPRLRVSETIEEERDILATQGEELVATDLGVQYVQHQKESIRLKKTVEVETNGL